MSQYLGKILGIAALTTGIAALKSDTSVALPGPEGYEVHCLWLIVVEC